MMKKGRNTKTFADVINEFIAHTEKSVCATGTLKIENYQLIHYSTPIAEHYEDRILLNMTRYSLATGKLQKQLKEMLPDDKCVEVKGLSRIIKAPWLISCRKEAFDGATAETTSSGHCSLGTGAV